MPEMKAMVRRLQGHMVLFSPKPGVLSLEICICNSFSAATLISAMSLHAQPVSWTKALQLRNGRDIRLGSAACMCASVRVCLHTDVYVKKCR